MRNIVWENMRTANVGKVSAQTDVKCACVICGSMYGTRTPCNNMSKCADATHAEQHRRVLHAKEISDIQRNMQKRGLQVMIAQHAQGITAR